MSSVLPAAPKGLIASGQTTSKPYDENGSTYVDLEFDRVSRTPIITMRDIARDLKLRKFQWLIQGSGVRIPGRVASALEAKWSRQPNTPSRVGFTFIVGNTYTRVEISRALGGGLQDFLPHKAGQVVCGAFRTELNPLAPEVILVGPNRRPMWAKRLYKQGEAVPVFIKVGPNQWEYRGRFRPTSYSTDKGVVRRYAAMARRTDVRAVLTMTPSETSLVTDESDPYIDAQEGRTILRMHRARERDPRLKILKKRAAMRAGDFACEACGLSFHQHAGGLGESCCQVHHIRPLSKLGPRQTTHTVLSDLALVCSNCHRMIHSTREPLPIPVLRRRLGSGT